MDAEEFSELNRDLNRRRGGRLLIADGVLVAIAVATYALARRFFVGEVLIGIQTGCLAVGCLQIIVFICVVANWAGHPIDLSFATGPTLAGRELIRRLKERPAISDREFYERFGSRYSLSFEQMSSVRRLLREDFDSLCDRVEPQEVIAALLYDLDFYDLYHCLARRFKLREIPVGVRCKDGTLEMLLTDVASALKSDQLSQM